MIDWFIDYFWTIILILIITNSIFDEIRFRKLEKRLEKLEPESEKNKKPKNWFQRLLKWW